MLEINEWLFLLRCTVEEAGSIIEIDSSVQLVSVDAPHPESILTLCCLNQLHSFANFIDEAQPQCSGSKLVLCVGPGQAAFTECAFLLGGYLIINENASVEHLSAIFEQMSGLFQVFQDPTETTSAGEGLTVHDGWRGLYRAKANCWLNFRDEPSDSGACLDMQEYLHYDNPLNGCLHVIIPSRLIAFQCPCNLSDLAPDNNGQWHDTEGRRYFGPAFYADLLGGDFGVEVVVRCDREGGSREHDDASDGDEAGPAAASAGYDESAFAQRGLAVERLAVPRDGALPARALLRDVDRFLTLARLVPGALAIHGGDGAGLGYGGELLASSLLIKRHGFDARSALAWVRVTHPAVAPRPVGLSLVPSPAAVPAAIQHPRAFRVRRASAPAILPSCEGPLAGPAGGRAAASAAGPDYVEELGGPPSRPLARLPAVFASAPDVFGGLGLNRASAR